MFLLLTNYIKIRKASSSQRVYRCSFIHISTSMFSGCLATSLVAPRLSAPKHSTQANLQKIPSTSLSKLKIVLQVILAIPFFEADEIIQYQFCLQSNSTITIDSIDHNTSIIILHPLRGSCDISSPLVALDPRRHDISAPLPQQARPLLRWSIVELRLRVKELQPRREIGVFNCLNGPTSNSRRLSCTRKEDGCLMCVSDSANVNSYNHSRIVLYWRC